MAARKRGKAECVLDAARHVRMAEHALQGVADTILSAGSSRSPETEEECLRDAALRIRLALSDLAAEKKAPR